MLYELVDCLRYLEEKGCYQGDIKPSNILLDENYTPKLIDSYFTHNGRSNFELVLSNPTTMAYLSP
jgi:serine/threonine protein kinase